MEHGELGLSGVNRASTLVKDGLTDVSHDRDVRMHLYASTRLFHSLLMNPIVQEVHY